MVVYALVDPRTGRIRYVGYTGQLLRYRLVAHLARTALARPTPLAAWLRELRDVGMKPSTLVLEDVSRRLPGEDYWERHRRALRTEREWIQYLAWLGAALVNTVHVLPRSTEWRRRQSETVRAAWRTNPNRFRSCATRAPQPSS